MAIKLVETRICDFCHWEACCHPCCLCSKDFCWAHGSLYRPEDPVDGRPRFDLCDVCAKEFAAKLAQAIGGDRG